MPSLWVKSDRSAVQLLARIVLPRTIDSKTGKPVTTLVAGTSYTDAGRWQELRITDMPRLLSTKSAFCTAGSAQMWMGARPTSMPCC